MNKNNIFVIMFLCILLIPSQGRAQEVLFSLPYGNGDGQINMLIPPSNLQDAGESKGPSNFFIDIKNGFVYIDLQKFNINGSYIGKAQSPNNPSLYGIDTCAWVDPAGNIYFAGMNYAGKDYVAKINETGLLIWIKSLSDIVRKDDRYEGISLGGIYVDAQGDIYLKTYYNPMHKEKNTETKCLKLDNNGNLLEDVPSLYLDNKGSYYSIDPVYSQGQLKYYFGKPNYYGDYASGADVSIYNSRKQKVKQFIVSFPDEYKNLENSRGVSQWVVDFAGNVYVAAYVKRSPGEDTLIKGKYFYTSYDEYVYKFNQKGQLVCQTQFPGNSLLMRRDIFVDDYQNVYYLQFHADSLDVMKVKTDLIPPTTRNSVSPAPNSDGVNNSAITVTLVATDDEYGSGVKEIHYKKTGAENDEQIISSDKGTLSVNTDGVTTLECYAIDNAGNSGTPETTTITIDRNALMLSLALEPFKIKLPFKHLCTPFFYKLIYSASDASGPKGVTAGLLMPDITTFKTKLITGEGIEIVINTDKKNLTITASDPQAILSQIDTGLLQIDNGQVMHLSLRPKADVWTITQSDKFLVISAPSIVFRAEAKNNSGNMVTQDIIYEQKKVPFPDECKPLIDNKELSKDEIQDLMEDTTMDADTLKMIKDRYGIK